MVLSVLEQSTSCSGPDGGSFQSTDALLLLPTCRDFRQGRLPHLPKNPVRLKKEDVFFFEFLKIFIWAKKEQKTIFVERAQSCWDGLPLYDSLIKK